MGARLMIEAVGGDADAPMAPVAPPRCLRFVFVAPDVRADAFKQRLARFPAGTARTMYCNSNDQARLWYRDAFKGWSCSCNLMLQESTDTAALMRVFNRLRSLARCSAERP
jgi:hypothetical protein